MLYSKQRALLDIMKCGARWILMEHEWTWAVLSVVYIRDFFEDTDGAGISSTQRNPNTRASKSTTPMTPFGSFQLELPESQGFLNSLLINRTNTNDAQW